MSTKNKMVCIKTPSGLVFRVSKTLAEHEVPNGAKYVSKSTFHSFWKEQAKLESNSIALRNVDFSKNQTVNFLNKESNGKTYAYLKRKDKRVIEDAPPQETTRKKKWWEKALETITLGAFKPNVISIENGLKQIISYPIYQKFYLGKI